MRRAWVLTWALFLAGILCIAQQERVSAFWQSRDSNYNIAISSGGGGSLTLTNTAAPAYQQGACCFSLGGTVTFSSVSIGTASLDRFITVAYGAGVNGAVSGITIDSGGGPVGMTLASQVTFAPNTQMGLYYLKVTSGTTATIVISTSGTAFDNAGIVVGAMKGSASASVSGSATPVSANAGADPRTIGPLTINANGLAVVAGFNTGSISSSSWSAGGIASGHSNNTANWIEMAYDNTAGSATPAWTSTNFTTVYLVMTAFTP